MSWSLHAAADPAVAPGLPPEFLWLKPNSVCCCASPSLVPSDGIESSLIPPAYWTKYGKFLLLTDAGKKVQLAALLRYHPRVRTSTKGPGVKFHFVPEGKEDSPLEA